MANNNYKAAKYTVEIEVAKSPDDVFNKVIDLSKWFPGEFEGQGIGLDAEFVFKTGHSHYSKNKVIEFYEWQSEINFRMGCNINGGFGGVY